MYEKEKKNTYDHVNCIIRQYWAICLPLGRNCFHMLLLCIFHNCNANRTVSERTPHASESVVVTENAVKLTNVQTDVFRYTHVYLTHTT